MSQATREPTDLLGQSNAHPNPMFNYLTGFMPRKLKDMFRWTEYLYYNSPHIFIALQKLVDYIITDVSFKTDNKQLRHDYEELFVKRMRIKTTLKQAALNRAIYGNGFVSVYFPFKRLLTCKHCNTMWDIRHVGAYKYSREKCSLAFTCKSCNTKTSLTLSEIKDIKIYDPKRINIIHWDPKQMNLTHNPITGETDYYYSLPSALTEQIEKGDPTVINGTPKGFLRAAKDKKVFKFDRTKIYHVKRPAPAGVDNAWGFPALIAVMKQFYYTEVLRKANEAIALDHLVPMRVLHPAATSGSNDPASTISLGTWIEETKKSIRQWRRDPLHIQFAPVALGVTQMGGQGRTLLTLGEIREAESNIISGLGIPREFIEGGLSFTGSAVTLRMLENQLLADKADSEGLLQWLAESLGDYMGWEHIETEITPFKFVDDIQHKSLQLQADATYQLLSRRSVAEMLDIDIDEEDRMKAQEAVEMTRQQMEIERKVRAAEASIAEQAFQEAGGTPGLNYDQQAVIGEADAVVQELMSMDESSRRSQLASMQAEDYVMYSVIIQRLEEARLQQTNEARAQIQQGM
jgi:hypothetical protein